MRERKYATVSLAWETALLQWEFYNECACRFFSPLLIFHEAIQ